jgi:hypothetical protein
MQEQTSGHQYEAQKSMWQEYGENLHVLHMKLKNVKAPRVWEKIMFTLYKAQKK